MKLRNIVALSCALAASAAMADKLYLKSGSMLTGKAGTVQRLRQRLKRLAVPASRIATTAYWAPGKTGLD